jgi:lactoylglutathione lyase
MEYLHTMIRVEDLDASLAFYVDALGLVQTRRKDFEKGRFSLVFLAAPEQADMAKENNFPELELTYNWPAEDGTRESYSGGRNFGHMAFRVDNIYESCERLQKAGVTINRPPRDGRMAFVRSPDNISIELLQKGDSLEPQEPWVSMENVGEW